MKMNALAALLCSVAMVAPASVTLRAHQAFKETVKTKKTQAQTVILLDAAK